MASERSPSIMRSVLSGEDCTGVPFREAESRSINACGEGKALLDAELREHAAVVVGRELSVVVVEEAGEHIATRLQAFLDGDVALLANLKDLAIDDTLCTGWQD